MEELIKILADKQYGYLATVDKGKPRVRPFAFLFEKDGKIYFSTNKTKNVYQQLEAVPYIEFSIISHDNRTVRLTGNIKFCEDITLKEKTLNQFDVIKQAYQTADNPIYVLFYIEHGNASILDPYGQVLHEVEF